MGWDTEITILAENLKNEDEATLIAQLIFDKDAKSYGTNSSFIKSSGTMFYHYERRKYAPYWVIQEISNTHKNIDFTILASCPDFVGGPAGLIRISKGEIVDSYGIGEVSKSIIRETIITEPLNYIPLIQEWFGFNGLEGKLRLEYISEYPKGWCNQNYADKIIPIPEIDELKEKYSRDYSNLKKSNWVELKINPYNTM